MTTDTDRVLLAAAPVALRWHGASESAWRWLPDAVIVEQVWLREGWLRTDDGRWVDNQHGGYRPAPGCA